MICNIFKNEITDKVISYISIYIYLNVYKQKIDVELLLNGQENLGSIPGHVISKTLKMVLDTSLLNTQQYKVHI